jgi:cobalamin biosynthetic protein CobC
LLEHGGALNAMAARYGIAVGAWLDLSTGINPWGWRPRKVPARVWQRLPEPDDGLERAAAAYYGSDQLLPVAGSQAAIQGLPGLREPARVGVLKPGYAEHAHAWRRCGHEVLELGADELDGAVDELDVVVVTNPNNPNGARFATETLLDWRSRLVSRGGWLVVDEAFMDVTPERSLAPEAGPAGLIVLRSLGKFFGLAGARIGFALADTELRARLAEQLGPWSVNGPGRWAATKALSDLEWQQAMREKLLQESKRLHNLLQRQRLEVAGGTALFQWLAEPDAELFQDALARRGILVRRFADPPSLRFGLPGDEAAMRRLDLALAGVRAERLSGF